MFDDESLHTLKQIEPLIGLVEVGEKFHRLFSVQEKIFSSTEKAKRQHFNFFHQQFILIHLRF